jgi:predicted nucleic acid-binding protein
MLYLQTLASPGGSAARCLRLAIDGELVELWVSRHVLLEVGDIFTRPSVRSKFPWVTDDEAYDLLQKLHAAAAVFPGTPPHFLSLPRDPKDEPYLDLAAAVGARYLVTWNHRHLGYLMDSDRPECLAFRARRTSLQIVDPVTFLREVEQRPPT